MDQVHVLRHKVLVEGRSQRQVAKELGISRLTVKKYLAQSEPVRRETKARARPVWETVGSRLEALLAWTEVLRDAAAVRKGDRVQVTLARGEIECEVHGTQPSTPGQGRSR